VTVSVWTTDVRVEDCLPLEWAELRDLLRVEIKGIKHSMNYRALAAKGWDGKKALYNHRTRTFGIGFLPLIQRYFGKELTLIEKRKPVTYPFKMPVLAGVELRDYQKEAVFSVFENYNGLIEVATNGGKTMCMSGICRCLHTENVLILVHTQELFDQVRASVANFTGEPVGVIMANDVFVHTRIVIGMVQTVAKRIGTMKEVDEFIDKVNVVMVDEAHHAGSATYRRILRKTFATYRIGFSGTIPDIKTMDGMQVREYLGDVLINVKNKELIERGISAKPVMRMLLFRHDIDYDMLKERVRAQLPMDSSVAMMTPWQINRMVVQEVYRAAVEEYIVNNVLRNAQIVSVAVDVHPDRGILITLDRIDHGNILYAALKEKLGDQVAFMWSDSVSRSGELAAFKDGRIRVLIVTSLGDEGLDISRVGCLILASGKKSRRQILQRIGRGLRRKDDDNTVYVYDFYDVDGGNHLEKHSKNRVAIYRAEEFDLSLMCLDVSEGKVILRDALTAGLV